MSLKSKPRSQQRVAGLKRSLQKNGGAAFLVGEGHELAVVGHDGVPTNGSPADVVGKVFDDVLAGTNGFGKGIPVLLPNLRWNVLVEGRIGVSKSALC